MRQTRARRRAWSAKRMAVSGFVGRLNAASRVINFKLCGGLKMTNQNDPDPIDPRAAPFIQLGWGIGLVGTGLIFAFARDTTAGNLWWVLLGVLLLAYSAICAFRNIPFRAGLIIFGATMVIAAGSRLLFGYDFSILLALLISFGLSMIVDFIVTNRARK